MPINISVLSCVIALRVIGLVKKISQKARGSFFLVSKNKDFKCITGQQFIYPLLPRADADKLKADNNFPIFLFAK